MDIIQGSPEWFQARLGKVTASRVADVIAKTKTGYGASRMNYMADIIAERLTGVKQDSYTNGAMAWGTECEPMARTAYMAEKMCDVTEVGFVIHPTILDFGASPDGEVDIDGMVEIKCPNTATHIDTLLSGKIPGKYITQMQSQMACTGRQWCDFVSYDSRLPERLQLFVQRVQRDDKMIDELETEIIMFLKEVDEKVVKLNNFRKGE